MAQINEWLSIDKTSGSGSDSVTLTALQNDGEINRSVQLVVKGRYGTQYVDVRQMSEAFLRKSYLWMEFEEEDGIVALSYGSHFNTWTEGILEYSFDGIVWTEYYIEPISETTRTDYIELNNHKIIFFRKKSGITKFILRGSNLNNSIGGDITAVYEGEGDSLCFGDNDNINDTLIDASSLIYPRDLSNYPFWCFANQFRKCISLVNPPELPATTLGEGCYVYMFKDCTSLTTAPVLPATEIQYQSYMHMFEGCTSLITAPELPATKLDSNCYLQMFAGCTSLITAPELPATELDDSCYEGMFYGCTSLVNLPEELPATILYGNCYRNMFAGCTSLVTTPKMIINDYVQNPYVADGSMTRMFAGCISLKTAQIIINSPSVDYLMCDRMFYGCTSLTTAPKLNSERLLGDSYDSMFEGCTSLSYIKMLGQSTSYGETFADNFTNWVKNVSPTGTFVKHPNANLSRGDSGIPSGWTIQTDTEIDTDFDDGNEGGNEGGNDTKNNNYFWVEFEDTNGVIKFLNDTDQMDMYHSFDGGVMWEKTPTTLSMGERKLVHFKNNSLVLNSLYKETWIDFTKYASIGGNLGALTNMDSYCCANLFLSNTHLRHADELRVHSTLATNCYYQMFYGCTSLITAPELPVTILADGCYRYMFFGCSSLTTAPVLPASELVGNCYRYMFNGCLSLSMVECHAEILNVDNGCLNRWMQNVSLSGTFIKKQGVTYPSGESGIPVLWSIQEIA